MNKFDAQLWQRFLRIAQPFFYPLEPGSSKVFLSLLFLLLIFLAATVFVLVSVVTILSEYFFSDFFNSIAPGLYESIGNIIYSKYVIIIILMLVVPIGTFLIYRNQIKTRWQPWAFLTVLLFFSLSVSGLNVIISYVGNFFSTALAERNQDEFWRFLYVYASVFIVGTPLVVIYSYTRDRLGNYWRKWLTDKFLDQYLSQRAFYKIESQNKIDNPDQRITEDIKAFTITSLRFLLIILSSIIDVISFTGILWSISKSLSVFLLIYASIGTIVTVFIGQRLIPLNFNQLKREADFRYGLIHVRDNAESIAFYQGEEQELSQVKERFFRAFQNFNLLIGWQRNVDYFTTSYGYAVIIIPSLILAPIYFAGTIKFGDINQAGFAFSQVLGAFSIVVSQIEILSAFAAGINRLSTFSEFLESPKSLEEGQTQIDIKVDDSLALEHVTVNTPNYQQILLKDLSLSLPEGQGLLIMGQSGVGKSSLLRTIAGLWTSGTGHLIRPELSSMLFLPQRPYMILGTLRQQLLYPNSNQEVSETELHEILQLVNLADLPERVSGFDTELDWANVLSVGEQQRLAFARLLISKPRYAILDEATSALDLKNEELLYKKLHETGTTYISVGHRISLLRYHDHVLELMGEQKWRLVSREEYRVEMI